LNRVSTTELLEDRNMAVGPIRNPSWASLFPTLKMNKTSRQKYLKIICSNLQYFLINDMIFFELQISANI
jgi:hypothetical protein